MSLIERLPDRSGLLGLGLTGLCGVGLIILDPVERFAIWSLAEGGLLLDEVVGSSSCFRSYFCCCGNLVRRTHLRCRPTWRN